MKTIEEMDEETQRAGDTVRDMAQKAGGIGSPKQHALTAMLSTVTAQRNAVVAERDDAMNLLREIVKYVDESDSWETLPRDVQHKARKLLRRLEGQ